jgi:hypothetical protein
MKNMSKHKISKFDFQRFRTLWHCFTLRRDHAAELSPAEISESSPAVTNIETAFKIAYNSTSSTVTLPPEWRHNLMRHIVLANRSKLFFPTEEVLCWRAAWTSLAAALVIASVIGMTGLGGDDSTTDAKFADKIIAVGDVGQE